MPNLIPNLIDPRADPEYGKYLSILPDEEYLVYPHLALLDEHERLDPKSGKKIKVDEKYLNELRDNLNAKVAETGDATPYVLGHTLDKGEDDEDVPESDQPEILGWLVNYKVDDLLNTNRKAVHGDLFIRKSKYEVAKEYPRRSVELWYSSKDVDPVSALSSSAPERNLGLLKLKRVAALGASTPGRNLGLLKYSRDGESAVYSYSIPTSITPETEMTKYESNDKKDEKPESMTEPKPEAKKDAKEKESASYKGLESKIDALMQMFQEFLSMLTEGGEGQGQGQGDGDHDADDMLQPADKEMPPPKGQDKEARKDIEKPPVKFDADSTNCYVPGYEEPKKMSRQNDEAVSKYERQVRELETARAKDAKRIEDLEKAARYARAEKAMNDLEKTEFIDFGDEAARKKELELMSSLKDDVFPIHLERAKTYYKRKTPAVDAVSEALRYSRTDAETTELSSREEVNKVANLCTIHGMSYEDALKKVKGTK